MLCILGLLFCFLLIAPKAVFYASQVIKLFSCWSILQAERLYKIPTTVMYLPIPSAGRKSLLVTNWMNSSGFFFFLDKARNTKMIYGNIVAVEVATFRWGTLTSSQVNFLTVASRSIKTLCPCLEFKEEISSCHSSKSWKYCAFRTHFPE